MTEKTNDLISDLANNNKTLKEEAPDYFAIFKKFLYESEKEGALSVKVKELISVALGLSAKCSFCIAAHTKKAAEVGATRQELIEAGMVAGFMGGALVISHLKYLFDAIDQLDIE